MLSVNTRNSTLQTDIAVVFGNARARSKKNQLYFIDIMEERLNKKKCCIVGAIIVVNGGYFF